MELISREDAIEVALSLMNDTNKNTVEQIANEVLHDVIECIYDIPTVEKQKEGHWIPVDSYSAFGGDEATWEVYGNPVAYHYCSECKEEANVNEFGEELLTKFCSNCGAKMKGK